jgi:branched-chain amino acid transport system permease protein
MKPRDLLLLLAAVALLAAAPLVGGNYVLRIGTIMLMYVALALSWNFIGGFAGYPSFATAAFFGLGAYAAAVARTGGVPEMFAWVLAMLAAGAFSLLLGIVILRLRGHAFAIASLVVIEVLREIVTSWEDVTGGGAGISLPFAGATPEAIAAFYYWSMLGLAAVTFAATLYVARSPLGFGLRCIRQNEDAAGMVGINTLLFKIAAFVLSGAFAAGAGAVYASWTSYIDPVDAFDIVISIKAIVMVLLGGAGTVLGPVAGALAFMALDEFAWRNFLELHTGILGVLVVLLVLFLPTGISSFSLPDTVRRIRRRYGQAARAQAR